MSTVYVSIGNSDDKLTQQRWSRFILRVDDAVAQARQRGVQIHGYWFSSPTSPFQNACWCLEFPDGLELRDQVIAVLRADLRSLAGAFGQDSIAWAECPATEFIGGA